MQTLRRWLLTLVSGALLGSAAWAQNSVPVGGYLYANPAPDPSITGGLVVRFATPGKRLVIAYGHKNRKDRLVRGGTSDSQRESWKPYKAATSDAGKTARFAELPPDFYDLIVIETDTMSIIEGVDLLMEDNKDLSGGPLFDEFQKSLSRTKDRIGGWEAFFDSKRFERFETDGVRGAAFIQQMRLGQALAESGAVLKGCIHSVDVAWAVKGVGDNPGWQVMNRQQLFREEMPSREFFKYQFRPELQGIRVGDKVKDVGVLLKP